MIRIDKEIYDSLNNEELLIIKLLEQIKSLEKEIAGLMYHEANLPFNEADIREYEDMHNKFIFLEDPAYMNLQDKLNIDIFEDDEEYMRDISQLKSNGYSKTGYPHLLK